MKEKFKISVCQLKVNKDKEKNIKKAQKMIREAKRNGAELVILPEMFNCPYEAKLFPQYAEAYPDGPSLKMLSETARQEQVYIIGGSIPERDHNRFYNTSFTFNPKGKILARHRKLHLFDVDLHGGIRVKESSTLGYGNQVTVFNTKLCCTGVAICYDVRFPELFRLMAIKGAQLIAVPGAFNMTTGPAHWEITFRLRAVDNQIYTVGASIARDYAASYVAYGHSVIVDPWGNVLARAGEEEEIIYAEIDLRLIDKIRSELPLLKHRRTDLYNIKYSQE